jgi:hypothetical protein
MRWYDSCCEGDGTNRRGGAQFAATANEAGVGMAGMRTHEARKRDQVERQQNGTDRIDELGVGPFG